jgi:F-type H+-transporting ATPase subunit epsilon
MNFELITLHGVKYKSDAFSVVLPTAAGQITVYPNHEPLMSVLVPGVISIRKNAKDSDANMDHYATYGGVVEISKVGTRVLVDEAEHSDEIDQAEAEKARDAAQKMMESAKSVVEINEAQAMMNRQTVKLQVSNLRRRHSGPRS